MCPSVICLRLAVSVLIITSLASSARSQAPAKANDQTTALIKMLESINSAVSSGNYSSPTEAYKTVSVRLFECAITYRMLSENAGAGHDVQASNERASDIFLRAATALAPGNKALFDQALKNAADNVVSYRADKDQKKLFYFLRSCKDFMNANSVEGAVRLLL